MTDSNPEAVSWTARFIVTQDGHVDLPFDRQSGHGPDPERGAFLAKLTKVIPGDKLREIIASKLKAREIDTRVAAEVVLFNDNGIRITGNSNASAGYFYVTAVPAKLTPDELMMAFFLAVRGEADYDVVGVLHDIIDDIRDSYRLALTEVGMTSVNVDAIDKTVGDYIANHYGEA